MKKKSCALVGSGRVGTSISYLLQQSDYDLRTVVDLSEENLERASNYLKGQINFTTDINQLPDDLDFIILGVNDDAIGKVAVELYRKELVKEGQVLVHLSGAHPSDVDQLTEMEGIGRLSIHPLQSVADVEAGISKLPHSVWSLEGDQMGRKIGEEILESLGVEWIEIEKEQKALYHASACVVSNYLVTLMKKGIEMLEKVGFSEELAQQALMPLVQGTVSNLTKKTPEEALTGPIARGDYDTIARHLQTINKEEPDWLDFYKILGQETVDYATLSDKDEKKLLQILSREDLR